MHVSFRLYRRDGIRRKCKLAQRYVKVLVWRSLERECPLHFTASSNPARDMYPSLYYVLALEKQHSDILIARSRPLLISTRLRPPCKIEPKDGAQEPYVT